MSLLSITWDVDPIIFTFGDSGIGPRWYSLMFIISFVLGYKILGKIYKNEGAPADWLDGAFFYTFVGVIAGARLGHVIFYDPNNEYLANPLSILKIWEGGLASHGALIGVLVALFFLYKKAKGATYLWYVDRVVITIALAAGFVRLGNLMNSEIYGTPTDLPWAFIFNSGNGQSLPSHPTQIYEAMSYFALFIVLYLMYWKKKGQIQEGRLFGWFLSWLFTARFLIEFLKNAQVDVEDEMLLNFGQQLSIIPILVGLYFILRKNPGVKPLVNPVPYAKKK